MKRLTRALAHLFIGIDVSRAGLGARPVGSSGKAGHKSFADTPTGFAPLLSRAPAPAAEQRCHCALELT